MDMCQFGMTTPNSRGEPTPAKKPTRWLTNSPCLAEQLERHCPGTHIHEPLLGGRAKAAQIYPPKLCSAIVAGFAAQLKLDLSATQVDSLDNEQLACSPPCSETPIFDLEILQVDPEDIGCPSQAGDTELNQMEDD